MNNNRFKCLCMHSLSITRRAIDEAIHTGIAWIVGFWYSKATVYQQKRFVEGEDERAVCGGGRCTCSPSNRQRKISLLCSTSLVFDTPRGRDDSIVELLLYHTLYPVSWAYQRHRQCNICHTALQNM